MSREININKMSQVNILVAVNVAAAISSGNLGEYVFMMDTNDYMGTGNTSEGTDELITTVNNGDTIVWTVASIDPNLKVSIQGFSGQAIPNLINPSQYPQTLGTVWGGHVNQAGDHVQYTMELLLNGTAHMSFDPFITSTNP
jgi:hypothetical protein